MLILAWTLFAFGAVYTWGSRPAVAASLLLFVYARPTLFKDSTVPVDSAITLLLGYGWLQCLPLPGTLVSALSPASVDFHRLMNLGTFDPAAARPLSLAPTASLDAMLNLTGAALLYWTVRDGGGRPGTRILVRAMAVMGALAVMVAVLSPLLFPNGKVYGFWTPIYREAQPLGPFISRNHFASWMLVATPITVGYLITHGRTYWAASTSIKTSIRMLTDTRALWVATCAALMGVGVLISQSRAGLTGLFAGALLALALSRSHFGRRGRIGLFVATLLFGGVAWITTHPSTGVLQRIEVTQGDDWGGRPAIWRATMDMAAHYPVFGIGLGAFEGAMPAYQTPPVQFIFNHAHSQYLQWYSEGGAVGAAIGLFLFVSGFRLYLRRHGRDRGSLVHLREGALAALVGLGVQSIWETPLVTPAVLWLAAVAAAFATERLSAHESASRPGIDRDPEDAH